MRKWLVVLLLGLAVCGWAEDKPKPSAVMAEMQAEITKGFKQLLPDGETSYLTDDASLRIVYHSRTYQVYESVDKGTYGDKLVEVTAPKNDGIIVTLERHSGKYMGAMANQLLRMPYWNAEFDTYPLAEEEGYVSLLIQYGSKFNEDTVRKLNGYVAARAKYCTLTAEEAAQQPRLIAAANAKLRDDLRVLAQKYPQLNVLNYGTLADELARKTVGDGITLDIGHYSGGKGGVGTPVEWIDRFRIIVVLHPYHPTFVTIDSQMDQSSYGAKNQYIGQITISAGGWLKRDLKDLVSKALEPLGIKDIFEIENEGG